MKLLICYRNTIRIFSIPDLIGKRPRKTPLITVSNHCSSLDEPLLFSALVSLLRPPPPPRARASKGRVGGANPKREEGAGSSETWWRVGVDVLEVESGCWQGGE